MRLADLAKGVVIPKRQERPQLQRSAVAPQRVSDGRDVGVVGQDDLLGERGPAELEDERGRRLVAELLQVCHSERREGVGELVGRQLEARIADRHALHDR